MYIACDINNNRVDISNASKNEEYFCPICKCKLIIKEGETNAKHFAHKMGECIDQWDYDMSEWHRLKQSYFPIENREVMLTHGGETHRADILIDKTVIEFQHSSITKEEFNKRNNFYHALGLRIVWVFDLSEAFESNNLSYSDNDDYLMIWKKPKRIFEDVPFLNDENKKFSLWFSWDSNTEEEDWIYKVIWTIKDEENKNIFSRFLVSPYSLDLKSNLDIKKFFMSKNEHLIAEKERSKENFKLELSKLKSQYEFKTKYIGEKGKSRECYICPRTNKFGLKIYSEHGCKYCRYCFMIAQKETEDSFKSAIYCCYPNQVQELCETHPGYECVGAPFYML